MNRKIILLLTIAVSFMLFSCGGGGGGGTSSSSDLTVKTTIDLPTGVTMAGAKDADGKAAAVNMTVTLTLPDGTVVTMTSTGNGNEYECSIAYTEGDPVFIKAVYGDIVLKNFIESIDTTSADVTLDDVTPTTTLFVDVLESMVNTLETVGSAEMVAHLLEGVKNATLGIDVTTVKEEVSDTGNTVYETLRNTYQAALTWTNVISGAVASDTLHTTVATAVETGGITIPAAVTDEASALETAAMAIMAKLFTGDVSAVAALIHSGSFLNGGSDGSEFLLDIEDEFGSIVPANMNIMTNTMKATKVLSGDPAYIHIADGPMYRIKGDMHYQYSVGGAVVMEEAYDDTKAQEPGFVFQKINGSWKAIGDQYSAEYSVMLTEDANIAVRKIHPEICEGAGKTITSASVTSTGFTGTVTLGQSPFDMECYHAEIYENGNVYGWDSITGWTSFPSVTTSGTNSFCGKTVTLTATFDDSTVESRKIILPACASKTVTSSAAKNGSGDIVVSYSVPNEADRSEIRVQISQVFPGGYEELMFEKEFLPFNGGSTTFDSSLFIVDETYRIRVHYSDKYNRLYIGESHEIVY